jgi:lipopolysaccharide/colanic/teichoic acid biosynthesis glycosyltransferase
MEPRDFGLLGKRIFDLAVAGPALVLLSPILLATAALVRWRLGTPVLFVQERPGRGEQPFRLVKFRTMREAFGPDGRPLPDKERLTPFGRFLRSTSLDELPELWNVLKGEMSLVGPRPLLMRYLPWFTAEERARFALRPGITGWAQIHGRANVPWSERLAMDVWYVRNRSFALDLRILASTVVKAAKREDIQAVPSRVMFDLDEERRRAAK